MQKNFLPELLSPAGSMQSLYAAVNNGCNAVYVGGKQFSARQYAGNFSIEELQQACNYCHLRNVKVYVTVNTLYKEKELNSFLDYVKKLYEIGVDALILQDIGAAMLVKKYFPDMPLHASTQLTVNHIKDVEFLYEQGFDKIVLSRELSLNEVKYIAENTEAEIEIFVHGALCVCYSGQCIMSSMLGGRSGNRGRCAQTCRLPYTLYKEYDKLAEGHLLSPKDMQTITILPELIESGVTSFKIEGRMKSPVYVAGVTQIYRKYLDLYEKSAENYEVDTKDLKILTQLFNRGGFTEGYYKTNAGSDMMSIERPKTWGLKAGFVDSYNQKIGRVTIRTREPFVPGDGIEIWTQKEPHVGSNISRASKAGEVISLMMQGDISKNDVVYKTHDKALEDALQKTWEKDNRKLPIYGRLTAKAGQPLSYQLWDNRGSVVYQQGAMVELAQKQPLSIEKLKQQSMKTGATPFVLESLEIDADDNIYVGISDINEIRRAATEALEASILKKSKRNVLQIKRKNRKQNPLVKKKNLNVLVSTKEQFDIVSNHGHVHILYYELTRDFEKNYQKYIDICHKNHIKLYAALPRIERKQSERFYAEFIELLIKSDIDGFLVRTPGQMEYISKTNKKITVDYTMNVLNGAAIDFWKKAGADTVCLSLENNLQEINAMADKDCEMVVYGYLPLMTTQQCPIGNFAGGKKAGIYCSEKDSDRLYFLKDRKGMKFPLMPDCKQCVCTILNGKPLFTLKFYDEILESTTGSVRLLFTKEGSRKTQRILNAYAEMTEDCTIQRGETKILLAEMSEKGSTKGHYFRGVE
ncbi:MAG TPA: DUF3656 domain-containing protein [Candidatus Coprocola pullicola]|nr:DUF3656 domain-containing protein [Candidatus Coprocola pullicola]